MSHPSDQEMSHKRGIAAVFARLPGFWQTATVAGTIFLLGMSVTLAVVSFMDLPAEVRANAEAIVLNRDAIAALREADAESMRDRDDIREWMSETQCMILALDAQKNLLDCIDDPRNLRTP